MGQLHPRIIKDRHAEVRVTAVEGEDTVVMSLADLITAPTSTVRQQGASTRWFPWLRERMSRPQGLSDRHGDTEVPQGMVAASKEAVEGA